MLSTSAYSPVWCGETCVASRPHTHGDLRKHNFLSDCPSLFLKSNTDPRWRKHLTNWDPRHNSLATDQESSDLVWGQKVSLEKLLVCQPAMSIRVESILDWVAGSSIANFRQKVPSNSHVGWIFNDEPTSWSIELELRKCGKKLLKCRIIHDPTYWLRKTSDFFVRGKYYEESFLVIDSVSSNAVTIPEMMKEAQGKAKLRISWRPIFKAAGEGGYWQKWLDICFSALLALPIISQLILPIASGCCLGP